MQGQSTTEEEGRLNTLDEYVGNYINGSGNGNGNGSGNGSENSGDNSDTNIASTVQVGDFVNYSAGNWTTTDIEKLGTLYAGEALPTSSNPYRFGGFKVGDSKDASITPYKPYANTFSQGWRVLSIDGDTVNIIHAGTPEGYYHSNKINSAYKSEYILNSNTTNTNVTGDIKSGVTPRDWSMYENTTYAVAGSARSVTYDEMYNVTGSTAATDNTLRKTGSYYWLPRAGSSIYLYYVDGDGSMNGSSGNCFGVRPVVSLKSGIKVTAKVGDTTHTTYETAWQLSE